MIKAANDDRPERLIVTEEALIAFSAGQLSPKHRRQIAGYLAANPDEAARVMQYAHMAPGSPPRRGRKAALALTLAAVAVACAISAMGGWTTAEREQHDGWQTTSGGTPPLYVTEADESREASDMRDAMVSQIGTPRLDRRDIESKLNVPLPRLPAGWRVLDVQVFPTDYGPSINIAVETAASERLQLFAVKLNSWASATPLLAQRGGETAAFWEGAGAAYVLSGGPSGPALLTQAGVLARTVRL